MLKTKDGYAKVIGTSYQGSSDYLLLSNGDSKAISSLSVNYATSAGNADKLDGIDSIGFLRYYNSNSAPSNVDIVNTSSYVWTVSTTGGSVANATKPSGIDNAWGIIHLHTHIGNYATQLGFGGTTSRMYMRNAYNTSTFGNWQALAFTTDNVASATKLQTARTIWGQSFDGTANISGTLSGVAHIQFSADKAYDIGSNSAASRYIYTYWLGAKSGQKLELGANNSGFGQGLCIDTNLNVGIGTNTPAYKLDVKGDIRATGQIIRNGSSQGWVNGRKGALLRETTSTGYHTLWSLKTANGSWDFGEYNSSGWNNIPVLSYITDTNFNSGNNTTTYQIKFPLDSGTVALTKNIPTSLPANGGNADTLDGSHLNGIFTAFGNNDHNITATIGGVTKSFLVNWATDSDKLDGYHADKYLMVLTIIDTTSLNSDTYYPVTIWLPCKNTRIEVEVSLDSGTKPSWSTHQNGFTSRKVWESNGSGWGATSVERNIFVSTYSFASEDPIRGIGQLTNSSVEFVYVRGGGKYYFRVSVGGGTPTLRKENYTINSQSVAPTKTAPDLIVPCINTPHRRVTLWGQSFNGTNSVSGSISNTGTITASAAATYDIGSNALDYRNGYFQWIGAKSNTNLRLAANNSDNQIVLHTNGNVGIGTASPAYKLDVIGDIYTTTGFKKKDSSNSYILLGGGGHKLISDFATSNHTHSNYVTALGTNSNYLTWTKNGSTNNITVPYATTSSYLTSGFSAPQVNKWDCNAPDRVVYSDYGSNGRLITNHPSGWYYGTLLELGHTNYRGINGVLNIQLMWDVAHGTTNPGTLWFRGKDQVNGWAKSWAKVITDQNISSILSNYYTKSETDGKYVTLATTQTIGGSKTFTTGIKFNVNNNGDANLGSGDGFKLFYNQTSGSNFPGNYYNVASFITGYTGFQLACYGGDNQSLKYRHRQDNGTWHPWKTLAFTTDIPSSLKNPYALTLKANGTTLAIYDGSSVKEANFNYANVGAASASHTHDDRYLKLTGGTMTGTIRFNNLISIDSAIVLDYKYSAGGFARNIVSMKNSVYGDANLGALSILCYPNSTSNGFQYIYLGTDKYDGPNNLRIYKDKVTFGNNKLIDAGNIGSQTVDKSYHLRLNHSVSANNTWSTWYWLGQSGQPTWLWGTNDGTNCYVWNPSNFSVAKSEYSRSLLGRSTSGSDYDTNKANLVFAEWNTMNDNRWYLKTTGYECRVAYANSAGNADTVDGYHANAFAAASHTHPYLPLSGAYITGTNIADMKVNIRNYFNGKPAGTNCYVGSPNIIYNFQNDSAACDANSVCGIMALNPGYDNYNHGHFLVSHYGNNRIGMIGLGYQTWYGPNWFAYTSDIPTVTDYYWANVKVSASSSTSTSPTFGSLWINNSHFFKQSGTTFTCQGGTTFTLPSSNINTNTALLWTTASDGTRDTGIFYNSSDFAFIANSNDHGAVFAVYDTDVTQDFEAGAREISVPGNGGALWARGGFSKNGSSDAYVLLGGGGHKPLSEFQLGSGSYLPYNGWWSSDSGQDVNNANGMIFAYATHKNSPFSSAWGIITTFDYTYNSNYKFQLAANGYSNAMYYRSRSNDRGGWTSWAQVIDTGNISSQRVAYATSAGSVSNSLNIFGVSYNGSAAKTVTTSTFISQLEEGTSTVTDGTMFITSWASDSGFADTNAVNVPYKRKASCLWSYIDSKVSSKYLPLAGGTMNGNARIGHGSGNLYIGNSSNDGWIYTQDIASQKGTDKWLIRESGAAHFGDVYICTKSDYSTYDTSIIECYSSTLYLNYYSSKGVSLCNGGGTVQIGPYTTGDTGNNKLYVNGSEFINGASNVRNHVFADGFRHRSHNSNDSVLLAGGGYSQGVPVRYWAIYYMYIGNSSTDVTYTKRSGNYDFITSKDWESEGVVILGISFPSGYNKNNTLIFGNGDHRTSSSWKTPVYVTITTSPQFGQESKIRVMISDDASLNTGFANIYFMCMG